MKATKLCPICKEKAKTRKDIQDWYHIGCMSNDGCVLGLYSVYNSKRFHTEKEAIAWWNSLERDGDAPFTISEEDKKKIPPIEQLEELKRVGCENFECKCCDLGIYDDYDGSIHCSVQRCIDFIKGVEPSHKEYSPWRRNPFGEVNL